MKRSSIFIAVFAVLFFALAVAGAANTPEKNSIPVQNIGGKNITYGKCVSDAAVIKNVCYRAGNAAVAKCKEQAKISTAKNMAKGCNDEYKKQKKTCMNVFKSEKKVCAAIRHNFFDEVGVMFK